MHGAWWGVCMRGSVHPPMCVPGAPSLRRAGSVRDSASGRLRVGFLPLCWSAVSWLPGPGLLQLTLSKARSQKHHQGSPFPLDEP